MDPLVALEDHSCIVPGIAVVAELLVPLEVHLQDPWVLVVVPWMAVAVPKVLKDQGALQRVHLH